MYSSVAELRREFKGKCLALDAFDSNISFGMHGKSAFRRVDSVTELLEVLDSSFITEAILTHLAAVDYDFMEGNELSFQAVAEIERLWASVVLMPDATGEMGNAAGYIDRAIKRKAVVARMFPVSHSFSMKPWCIGVVLEALQERSMPLMLWHTEVDWDDIHSICSDYPELPVIIEGTGRKILYDARQFYQLISVHKNLHIETHSLINGLIIEDMVGKFGPEQLVFGSHAPYQEPAAVMLPLTEARISEEAKRLIAGGNLRRILSRICR